MQLKNSNQHNLIRVSASSSVGKVRELNEDAICVGNWTTTSIDEIQFELSLRNPKCLAIADGIGGHTGGAEASSEVVKSLSKHQWKFPIDKSIEAAVHDCEKAVRNKMMSDPSLGRMGSTVAGVVLHGLGFHYFNVGDSRVYLHRKGSLKCLSIDDVRPSSGALTQSIGGTPGIVPQAQTVHIGSLRFQKGQSILICSDGLTDMVSESRIQLMLDSDPSIEAKDLVCSALNGGGVDNISVLVASL